MLGGAARDARTDAGTRQLGPGGIREPALGPVRAAPGADAGMGRLPRLIWMAGPQ